MKTKCGTSNPSNNNLHNNTGMKKILIFLLFAIIAICSFAQSSSNVPPRYYVNPNARYQLFPTENRWNFINLDTQTGKMRMVQYSTGSTSNSFTYNLSDISLVDDESTSKPGRFTLYPTQNIFNFILLDQTDGRAWQVQWSTKPEEVGLWRIW